MTKYIIKETTIRPESHPTFINEWFCGKDCWIGEASLPLKYIACEHGWNSRRWAERRIAEKQLSDAALAENYEVNYTKKYEVVEVEV